MKSWKGYSNSFIGQNFTIDLPDYNAYTGDIATNIETNEEIIPYQHFSIVQSKSRRIPIISASNIYRTNFIQTARAGSFKKDSRLDKACQLTTADYKIFNSIKASTIEKGHMTKREDVQWSVKIDEEIAQAASKSTFYYPNAAPQHDRLNNGIWKNLENSIIIKGHVPMPARIAVFTGPVLNPADPYFNGKLADGSSFKVPVLFWKVVYYTKADKKLYCASFLMGQEALLIRDKIIKSVAARAIGRRGLPGKKPFLVFDNHQNYQVPISLIETMTKLSFTKANDLHKGKPPVELSLIQARNIGVRMAKMRIDLVEGISV